MADLNLKLSELVCAHGRYPVLKAPTGAGGSAPNLRCRDGQRFETGAIEVRSKKSGQALKAPINSPPERIDLVGEDRWEPDLVMDPSTAVVTCPHAG